ncbi:inositol monophosphatase [Anaerobacillus alkalilacustris]|uniref:inositol-phosphate phosphatase n=1 Tax=Anaerobacillus alkalilacustris TaxID=393763 RepID=A0A1S2LLG3_9BACI|nr:inositol monophosphatase family protein [Anaerobacillus alkalilacustris]OIJ13301.1 inositol monophosphatase [Anaerobacillus alkalilacustris]
MSDTYWDRVSKIAKHLVRDAAKIIKNSLEKELIVEFKSNPNDLVTEMDRKVEGFFEEAIKKAFPDHLVLGEEGTGKEIKTLDGIVWIIDPIDGTTNFVHQQRHFAISVGIYENGIGKVGIIYDVMADEFFYAKQGQGAYLNGVKLPELQETSVQKSLIAVNPGWLLKEEALMKLVKDCRGARSIGAAAIELTAVAANRMDAYISLRLSPWDFAGGLIILEEVGAKVTTLEGKKLNLLEGSSIFVAKNRLFEEIQEKYLNNSNKK